MKRYAVYVRDAESGSETPLLASFFGGFDDREEAERACAWYRENALGPSRSLGDVYVVDEMTLDPVEGTTRNEQSTGAGEASKL